MKKITSNNLTGIIIFAIIGLFIILCLLGFSEVYPEYVKEKLKGEDDFIDLKLRERIEKYGVILAILVMFVLPLAFNISIYFILGWKITIGINLIIYIIFPYWEKRCGWKK